MTGRRVYSASAALKTLGDALDEIRRQDGLTWKDMGKELGRSEDQAAKYADGSAEMGVVAFGRGKRAWGARFSGPFERLCHDSRPGALDDFAINSAVVRSSLALAEALHDGEISPEEVRLARPALEQARDAIEELLRRGPPGGG